MKRMLLKENRKNQGIPFKAKMLSKLVEGTAMIVAACTQGRTLYLIQLRVLIKIALKDLSLIRNHKTIDNTHQRIR